MSPEFSAFISANGTVIVIVLGVLAAIGLVQWRKVRIAEAEQEYKQALFDKGATPAEIERAAAARASASRRGLVEQFAALSGGAKAGIIAGGVIVSTVAFGCITGMIHTLAFVSHVREQQAHAPPQASLPVMSPLERADGISGHTFYLDLQPVANQKLTDVTGVNGHSFANVPQKRRDFGGVPFQVGPGYVRLRGKNRPELPLEVTDVRVGLKFDKLHILHGTEYGALGDARHHVPEGTEIGRYRVGYDDEIEETIPVVYGQDVRDAWNWDRSRGVTRGKVVWTGTSPGATKEGVSLRLYLTTWTNPRPDVEVTSIDFVSTLTPASPFCVAVTAERAAK
jgi:hypothetical protein